MNGQPPMAARRIAGEPTGPGTFVVPSNTDPGQSWAVEWQSPRARFCGCPGFAAKDNCRHVFAVFEAVRREFEAKRAGGPTWPKKETTV